MITKKLIGIVLLLVCSAAAALIFFVFDKNARFRQKIYPNVYIDNQSVEGKTKKNIEDYFRKKNTSLQSVNFRVLYQNEYIATFSGSQLQLAFNGEVTTDRANLIGRTTNLTSRIYQQLAALFHWQRFDFESQIDFDPDPIQAFINDSEDRYNQPAKNALFKFENGKVTSFRKETLGNVLLSDQFMNNIKQNILSLKQKTEDKVIILQSKSVEPETTLAQANNYGIREFIAQGQSDYSGSIPGRIHNILLAASKFNGILIPKGKIFSFNDIVGDISADTGYEQAYIIKGGRTVLGDGGGVCQVSTTLFRAALHAGLPIIERHAHAYRVGYYESDAGPGFDATVFAPSVDLKIKNDTPASLLIETEVDQTKNILTFKFYGTRDDRKVEIGTPVLYDVTPAPPPIYQDDPTLKTGMVKQVDFAAPGGKADFTYKVYKDNKLVINTDFFSAYQPWQAVYLRGIAD